jgi:fused signal recognition particle receptor
MIEMFSFLKKKIDSFTEKIKTKIEKKEEVSRKTQTEEPKKEVLERIEEEKKEEIERELKEKKIQLSREEKELESELGEEEKEVLAEIKKEEKKKELEKRIEIEKEAKALKEIEERIEREIRAKATEETLKEKQESEFEKKLEEKLEEETEEKTSSSGLLKERELKAKVSLKSKVKKFFTGRIKIEEKDIKEFLDEFELSLLESDVEQETAKEIVEGIKKELIGKEIQGNVTQALKREIALVLEKVMNVPQINLEEKLKEKKPFIILFLGPNGAGKTTSIAKIAFRFKEKGKKVILSASDTFRAASIEQIEKHAEKLGVRLIKHKYGSDPAAVAFDAVNAAKAKGIDLVLVDSAGRQETNVNLMNELKKIDKVIKPDLKLFVGEAMAGNSLLEQAKEFNEKIGFDGFILTKIDSDTKGGTAISLISTLKKPVLFVGTGQSYKDLIEFTPRFLTQRIIK